MLRIHRVSQRHAKRQRGSGIWLTDHDLGLNICYASLSQRYWPNAVLLLIKLHRLTFTLFLSVIVYSLSMPRIHSISLPETIFITAMSGIIVALVILDIFLVNNAVKQALIERSLRYKQLKNIAIKSFSMISKP